MRTSKVIAGIVIALVFFAACNVGLTFVLEPHGSRSQLAWTDYERQDDLDTILAGTSHIEYGVDPAVLNEDCGYDAYNLGTPSQTIEESFVAIRTAYEDHQIKRAILGISPSALTSSTPPNPGSAFMRNRARHVSPLESLATLHEFMWHYGSATTAYSINFPFPWASNPVRSLAIADLQSNIKAKLEGADEAKMARKLEAGWRYVGLGHGGRRAKMDLNGTKVMAVDEATDEDEEAGAATVEDSTTVNPDRERTVRELCDYCAEHGIELIAIAPPQPVYNVFDERSTYLETMGNISALFESCGTKVYNFNLVDSELFDSRPKYFTDNYHLNLNGAQVFSHALAQFLNRLDAGENVDELFKSPEEKVRELDYIAAVFATTQVDSDGIHLDWRTVTDPDAEIEYQVLEHHRGGPKGYALVSDWSSDTSFTYLPADHGTVNLRIYARHVGSEKDYERYRTVKVLW